MTAKLHYILLELDNDYRVVRYRQTLFEMLQDSGFTMEMKCHPLFEPLAFNPLQFKTQFQNARSYQLYQVDLEQQKQHQKHSKENNVSNNGNNNDNLTRKNSTNVDNNEEVKEFKFDLYLMNIDSGMNMDPFSIIKPRSIELNSRMPLPDDWTYILEKLQNIMEWSLFIYCKQDLNHLSNNNKCGPILEKLFPYLVDQAQKELKNNADVPINNSNYDNSNYIIDASCDYVGIPRVSKDILVVFCRHEQILYEVYQYFYTYCKYYEVTDGVIVSANGCRTLITHKINEEIDSSNVISKIEKTNSNVNEVNVMKSENEDKTNVSGKNVNNNHDINVNTFVCPSIRILAFKGKAGLFYNIIRYHSDIPLCRRLNSLEVQVVKLKFGSTDKFPKLKKKNPVCQYYGFRTGDVIMVNKTIKKIGKDQLYSSVLEQIDQEDSWIDEFCPCIVIND